MLILSLIVFVIELFIIATTLIINDQISPRMNEYEGNDVVSYEHLVRRIDSILLELPVSERKA